MRAPVRGAARAAVAVSLLVFTTAPGAPAMTPSDAPCAEVPATAAADDRGCALDADGDRIPDYRDLCPGTLPIEQSRGVDAYGCPRDSDSDGLADWRDRCPGTGERATIDDDGCSDVQRAASGVPAPRAHHVFPAGRVPGPGWSVVWVVYFGSGSTELASEQRRRLRDEGLPILQRMPRPLAIVGHTDSRGSAAANERLGLRRAQAVKRWLVRWGMRADDLVPSSRGEADPAERPADAPGSWKDNRRVEIHARGAGR